VREDVNIIDGQNVITSFIEAAMDLVGHEDRTKDLSSKKYDENLRSVNSVKVLSNEACDEEGPPRDNWVERDSNINITTKKWTLDNPRRRQ
jgi:hypothetical protein